MATIRCPTCSQQFDPSASKAMPFCSDRCRRIDLGRWLNEDISVPFRELPEDDSSGWSTPHDDDDD